MFKLKSQETPESDVQKAVLLYLQWNRSVAWAERINTGAAAGEYIDRKGLKKKRFVKFGFDGCSDIIGQMKDGRFLAVECKSRKGKISDSQHDFLNKVIENNGVGIVARCVEDVAKKIEEV